MKLDKLFRQLFISPGECRMFLVDSLEDDLGMEIWQSTRDAAWTERAYELVEKLTARGLVNRRLFEKLVVERPQRADDIAATCREELDMPFSYATGNCPDAAEFPWQDYEEAMSPGLKRLLRFAAYDARSRGFRTISTSEIFRVYSALQPWIRTALPIGKIKTATLAREEDPFSGEFGASRCVSLTVHGLSRHAEQPYLLTEHDVFLDLARFGAGNTARKFAPDGFSLERLNELSRELGIGRVTRHAVLEPPGNGA